MNKSSHFIGQPAYGQLISLLDKAETLVISRSNGGERYVRYDYVPAGGGYYPLGFIVQSSTSCPS